VLLNLLLSMLWFASLVMMVVGLFWALVAFGALVEGGIALFVLFNGYSPVGIAGPLLGLAVSLCNFNLVSGSFEMFALALMTASLMSGDDETSDPP